MLKDLLNSKHMYAIFKTIYEQGRSYFTLSQLIKPHNLDKGNTTRYLKKLSETGLITKLDDSAIYVVDRENITIQALFNLIKLESLNLTYSPDQHIFLKYEKYFRNQRLHHSRVEGAPFFLSIVCEAEQKDESRKRGCHHKFMPYVMQEGHIDRYLSYNDLHEVTERLMTAAHQGNKHYLRERLQHREQDRHAFDAFADMFAQTPMDTRTLKETTKHLTEYIRLYIQAMSRSSILEACRFDGTPTAVSHIHDYLTHTYSLESIPSPEEVRGILTTPLFPTYIDETYYALRTIALEIKNTYPSFYEALQHDYSPDTLYEKMQTTTPFLAQMIADFTAHHYQGISFARVRTYSLKEMFELFSERFKNNTDIEEQLKTTDAQKKIEEKRFKDLIECYSRDITTRTLISYLQDIQRLKDISTRYVLKLHYHGNRLLDRLAVLKQTTLQTLLRMSYDEVLLYCHDLIEPKSDVLEQRITYSLCIQKDHRYHFYLGNEAKRLQSILLKDTACEFTGMRWSVITPGIAVGAARTPQTSVILKKGDIVVARHRNDLTDLSLTWIAALLLEEEFPPHSLHHFLDANPWLPVIVHVDGLLAHIAPTDILHVDAHFGRVTILQKNTSSTLTVHHVSSKKDRLSPTTIR